MTEMQNPAAPEPIDPEILRRALKAFKKRLKLTALDEDSRLGRGPFSGGSTGVIAIQAPDQYPQAVWDELCKQGKLRCSRGLYELRRENEDR